MKKRIASSTITVNGVEVLSKVYEQDVSDARDVLSAFTDGSAEDQQADTNFHDLFHRMESEHGADYADGIIERAADEMIVEFSLLKIQ